MAPCHSAVPVWTVGVMSDVCCWDTLCRDAPHPGGEGERGTAAWVLADEAAARRRVAQAVSITDIRRHPPKPVAKGGARSRQRAIIVGALDDAYIPAQSVEEVAAHLARSSDDVQLRWVGGGHCWAVLMRKPMLRDAIAEVLSAESH